MSGKCSIMLKNIISLTLNPRHNQQN